MKHYIAAQIENETHLESWQIRVSENSNWQTALTLILQTMELLWKADIWEKK